MKSDSYFSISKGSEGLYKAKGSKFLAYAFPVRNETDIENSLREVRSAHHAARHHCYAYRLGLSGEPYRANDDGEPSGSAGIPIYGQLLSLELSDVLVVVVRYFGGTKLGVGGLIQAYKTAAREALHAAERKEVIIFDHMELEFPYTSIKTVMQMVDKWELKIEEQSFTDICRMRVGIRRSQTNRLITLLEDQILIKFSLL
jgi:uncharacterized YigZ family protein